MGIIVSAHIAQHRLVANGGVALGVLACTGMYWGALGSAQQTLLTCTEVNWAGGLGVLGSACMCWHVLECTGVCLYVLACTEVYWDVLGCTGVYLVYLGKLGVLGDIGQIMS